VARSLIAGAQEENRAHEDKLQQIGRQKARQIEADTSPGRALRKGLTSQLVNSTTKVPI
jgi:hypothetical protein